MPTSLPERPLDHADPVAAFLDAHDRGRSVALPTSGTSGTPRWVLRSTASWVDSFEAYGALAGLGSGSRVWVPGPLSATMNLFAATQATWAGAALVDDPADATHAALTPSAVHDLLGEWSRRARPTGVTLVVAGDRLPAALADEAEAAGLTVHHYYGAAELSFVAWGRDEDSLRPFPGVEVECRDGEVWVRSGFVCAGYSPDGAEGPLRRQHCWATVGDRGRTEDGRLVVHGRAGAVTTAGQTVHLADVEAVLTPHATGEVVVLGLPHSRLGQVLAAVLTKEADHAPLRARARAVLDGGHRPRLWYGVPALPHTGAGKVDRAALASLLADPAGPARRLT